MARIAEMGPKSILSIDKRHAGRFAGYVTPQNRCDILVIAATRISELGGPNRNFTALH